VTCAYQLFEGVTISVSSTKSWRAPFFWL